MYLATDYIHPYKGVLEIRSRWRPSARAKASIRQPGAFTILGVAPGVEGLIS